jgi:2-polyprenyl-3-methyl-5-hydroxy-6-metoxy-1,4-benzoquinol methylase
LQIQTASGTGELGEDRISAAHERRIAKELRSLEKYRLRNCILEIGPGRGWFLRAAGQAGWETWAVEVNTTALRRLQALGLTRIVAAPAEEFDASPESVDVIRMWDVIEHLQSPNKALTRIFNVLRPGGALRLATTNYASLSRMVNGPEWVYLNGADHIHLFTPKTIRAFLEAKGFRNVQVRTKSFNLRRKLYHPARDLPPAVPLLVPFRKLIDEAIRITQYGHQMIVHAERPD